MKQIKKFKKLQILYKIEISIKNLECEIDVSIKIPFKSN